MHYTEVLQKSKTEGQILLLITELVTSEGIEYSCHAVSRSEVVVRRLDL